MNIISDPRLVKIELTLILFSLKEKDQRANVMHCGMYCISEGGSGYQPTSSHFSTCM